MGVSDKPREGEVTSVQPLEGEVGASDNQGKERWEFLINHGKEK